MILNFVEILLKHLFQCYMNLPCPFGLYLEDFKTLKLK